MPRISPSIADLPNEADVKDEELKEIIRKYNIAFLKLVTTLYGDLKDHEERISDLE